MESTAYRGVSQAASRHGQPVPRPGTPVEDDKHAKKPQRGWEVGTLGALALSVTSSVSIVVVNKYLISSLGFNFATTLTGFHALVTMIFMHGARMWGMFEYKPLNLRTLLLFGCNQGVSIGFLNLCLGYNSVGFYQMTKLAIIPFTVGVEIFAFKKKYSAAVKSALGILLLGVGVATVTDLQLNVLGTVLSLGAIATTCASQIWIGDLQKRHGCSSSQLLYVTSPIMAGTLLIMGPPMDLLLTGSTVLSFDYTGSTIMWILISCCMSIGVNLGTFMVVGRCGPVAYQVVGHLKTCLVLLFGFVVLKNPATGRNLIGIGMAMAGMVAYGVASERDKREVSRSSLPVTIAEGKV